MANIIEMPKLSDTMTVGTLLKWLKKEGDAVQTGDMLAEVETDKATMELESFFDGMLLKLFVPAGSQVPIGAPLCAVGQAGETVEAPASAASAPAAVPAAAARASTPAPTAAPPSPSGAPAASAAPAAKPAPAGAKTAPAAPAAGTTPSTSTLAARAPANPSPVAAAAKAPAPVSVPPAGRIRISPLARKVAAEKGLDPSRIDGSGPGGRIVRADVLAAEKAGAGQSSPARGGKNDSAAAVSASLPSGPSFFARGPIQEERVVTVSAMRATIARRLLESKTQIPHFYLEIEVDAEPLLTLRAQLNAGLEKEGVKLSVNDFILKGSAEALRRVPAANASWDTSGAQPVVRYYGAAHVSFAVALDEGLITPVIRDAQDKTIFAIGQEARSLGKLARERKLQPAQFIGGTFCVSNLGMMGIDRFSAIINPPNAAILAVGATVKKPVVQDDRIVIGQRMSLTLSCDHRVVDGAIGATYLAALRDLLEKPALLLI